MIRSRDRPIASSALKPNRRRRLVPEDDLPGGIGDDDAIGEVGDELGEGPVSDTGAG